MQRLLAIVLGLVVGGCGVAPASPSGVATIASPSPEASLTSPAAPPPSEPDQTPSPPEIAAAEAAVDAYTRLPINGDWAAAWSALAAGSRTQWASFADFRSERAAYFKSVAGQYTVTLPPTGSDQPIDEWARAMGGATIDPGHAVLVEVDYPKLALNNAGYSLYLVQPGASGLEVFDVR
jgi:hypothetical protein